MATLILFVIVLLLVLVIIGVDIAIALGVASFVGALLLTQDPQIALALLGTTAYEALRKDIFIVIPLFVLMGDFVARSGAAKDLYSICNRALRRLPACLAIATVLGNSLFAAMTGVSIASAAAFSRIAYPEMTALGYDRVFSVGVIAGSACLGMLIPPSILLIIWAVLTEESIGALFIAGVIPGIVLSVVFALYCIITAVLKPEIAPAAPLAKAESLSSDEKRKQLIGGAGIIGLILLVIGGIWSGLLTPTESAGFGVLGAFLIALTKGLKRKEIIEAIYQAGKTTAPILILLVLATAYSRLLAMSGAVDIITESFFAVSGNGIVLISLMIVSWLLLGMFVDSTSIILLTVPIFAPMASVIGVDALAFGIFGILVIEAGLLTPPFGILIYTVKGAVPDDSLTLGEIFKGAIPYWLMILFVAIMVLVFPAMTTWLPQHLI
ncbi:MAG: TRAP transporter large permease [Henriciella sp.]